MRAPGGRREGLVAAAVAWNGPAGAARVGRCSIPLSFPRWAAINERQLLPVHCRAGARGYLPVCLHPWHQQRPRLLRQQPSPQRVCARALAARAAAAGACLRDVWRWPTHVCRLQVSRGAAGLRALGAAGARCLPAAVAMQACMMQALPEPSQAVCWVCPSVAPGPLAHTALCMCAQVCQPAGADHAADAVPALPL